MTSVASTLWLFIPNDGGDTFRKDAAATRESISVCEEKLADPLIRDRFDIRRASLLRAKAIHQIAAGDPTGALASLDLAAAIQVEVDGEFYQRSFGLGIDYVRAYALEAIGQREPARILAHGALDRRPYSTQSTLVASILMSRFGSADESRAVLKARSRLDPRRIDLLYTEALRANRWDEAVALYPQLVPPRRYPDAPGYDFQVVQSDLENRARSEIFWAARAGTYAIALAEMGRRAEAQEALAAARARVERVSQATPPLETGGRTVKSKYLPEYAQSLNAEIRNVALPMIALAEAQLAKGIGVDKPLAEDNSRATPLGDRDEELTAMLSGLPEVEIASRIPQYREARKFFGSGEGWTETRSNENGAAKITFRARASTAAVVEELALLRAAQFALAEGKSGFIVTDRTDIQHTVAGMTYGVQGPSFPDGYSVELDIVAVNPGDLPDAYRTASWRVLDAHAVTRTLSPTYLARSDTNN